MHSLAPNIFDVNLEIHNNSALPEKVVETVERTRHKWGFVSKLSEAEKWKLASTNDTVSSFTNKPGTGQAKRMPVASTARTTGALVNAGRPRRGAGEHYIRCVAFF